MKPEQLPNSGDGHQNIDKLIAERFPKDAILRESNPNRIMYKHRVVPHGNSLSYFKEFVCNYDLTQPEADRYFNYLITWAYKKGKLSEHQQGEMLKFVAIETARQRRGH